MRTDTRDAARGTLAGRLWSIVAGALAALVPVIATDVRGGTAGVLGEAALLVAAGFALTRIGRRPLDTGLWLLAGAVTGEAVALALHSGLAVFAGAWAPAGAQLLVAVPAVLAGCAAGAWRSDYATALATAAAGVAAGAMLASRFPLAAALLLAGAAALALLRPRLALPMCALLTGCAGLAASVAFFARAGGPGPMWPVVLPVQALLATPLAFVGGGAGVLIARLLRRGPAGA